MNTLPNISISYLQEEIRSIKKLISSLNDPSLVAIYKEDIMKLEEAFLQLRTFTRRRVTLKSAIRQEFPSVNELPIAPPGNIPPPSPTPRPPSLIPPSVPEDVMIPDVIFTPEELAENYNGLRGNPSYVAFNGIVFDVSNIATWGGGTHFGLMAGSDVTPGARACGYHNPSDLMRILPPVGYFEAPPDEVITPTEPITPLPPVILPGPLPPITPLAPLSDTTTPLTPGSPITPVAPGTPTVPADPLTPVAPISPIAPGTPTPPITPTAPVPPISPLDSTLPVTPGSPITPAAPVPPISPLDSITPGTPTSPITPTAPASPISPISPVSPASSIPPADPLSSTIPPTSSIPPTPGSPIAFHVPNRLFTLQELKNNYNGKNGHPAYIALCGIVFDATSNATWRNSKPFGLYVGEDLTHKLPPSHHNILNHVAKVLPAVGKIKEM